MVRDHYFCKYAETLMIFSLANKNEDNLGVPSDK